MDERTERGRASRNSLGSPVKVVEISYNTKDKVKVFFRMKALDLAVLAILCEILYKMM
jgi:hypothetical protein